MPTEVNFAKNPRCLTVLALLLASLAVLAAVQPASAQTGDHPTVGEMLGRWEWVSTLWGWTGTPVTPETEGYSQTLEIEFVSATDGAYHYLVYSWYRDGSLHDRVFEELDSPDLDQVMSYGWYGDVFLDGTTLTLDSYSTDGARHVFEWLEPIPVDEESWSSLKSRW